eukprot:c34686_g1_i1 orf=475-915(-)
MNPDLAGLTFSLERALSLAKGFSSSGSPDDLSVLQTCLTDVQHQIDSFLGFQERQALFNHCHEKLQESQHVPTFLFQQHKSPHHTLPQQELQNEVQPIDEDELHASKRQKTLGMGFDLEYDFHLMRKQVKAAEQRHKLDLILQFHG